MKEFLSKLKNKTNIKCILTILIFGFFFFGFVFAQEPTNADIMDQFAKLMNGVLNFLSWAWILFASMAGKLMTNDFIYGEFMHLDIYLWKIRNIMKNFANYAIGFVFLFYIIQSIFKMEGDIGGFIKTKVLYLLIAGVLVQASWFLFGALIDISTIATSAIGSFPAQFIASDNSLQSQITKLGSNIYKTKYTIDASDDGDGESIKYETGLEIPDNELKKLFDMIQPKYNSVSGPLVFIGATVFNFQSFSQDDTNITTDIGKRSIAMLIRVMVIVLFTFAMLLLFILNMIRVVFLWIFIAFSPIIILVWALGKAGTTISGLPEWMKLETVIKLVFQPVIFIAKLSIMLILILGVHSILIGNIIKINGTTIESQVGKETIKNEMSSLTLEGSVFPQIGETFQSSLSLLIIYIVVFYVLRDLVKTSASTSVGQNLVDRVTKSISGLATSMPIIPLGGGNNTSISSMGTVYSNIQTNINSATNFTEGNTEGIKKLKSNLDKLTGTNSLNTFSETDEQNLDTAAANGLTSFDTTYPSAYNSTANSTKAITNDVYFQSLYNTCSKTTGYGNIFESLNKYIKGINSKGDLNKLGFSSTNFDDTGISKNERLQSSTTNTSLTSNLGVTINGKLYKITNNAGLLYYYLTNGGNANVTKIGGNTLNSIPTDATDFQSLIFSSK